MRSRAMIPRVMPLQSLAPLGRLSFLVTAFPLLSVWGAAEARQPAQTKPPFVLTKGVALGAAINIPDKNLKLAGALFIPDSARRIRAVLVVMDTGQTEALLLTGGNPYSLWHAAADSLSCALLHLRIAPVRAPEPGPTQPETDPARNAAAGGGEGLLVLMRQFARESGRSELADVPFVFWGWSSAAGFGPSFARMHPRRTVGFVRYHSHLRGLPVDLETAKEIPALLIVGGADGPALAEDAKALFDRGRAVGAPWALVVQRAAPHEIRTADVDPIGPLTMRWIAAVVNARVRPDSQLQRMTNEEAWLGDLETGGISRARDAEPSQSPRSWLPDESTATAWRSLVAVSK